MSTLGTLYSYIAVSFLNGFLNYATPILRAYMVHRYETPEDNVKAAEKFNNKAEFHTDLNIGDDILLTKNTVIGICLIIN